MENLDKVREQALKKIDRAQQDFKFFFVMMAVFEGVLLLTYLLCMDFHERLHWLILIAALLTYGTIVTGLFTLGAYLKLNVMRILKALELHSELNDESLDV
ncbi:hypothetical protein [Candidatus Uabimicrobium amorphum]|uniref:Uncharacterized protein n=1 Tax=Uabimicrobium amorphum TaxID=2596890 RepID=A0A5S9IV07_UABAM|nr:hypothetical protein [Candidatus Uabimicrobium amorphum]BBM88257.1 hypothetical protein UABAM_06678 [Candidatus Uabimicrobium amorphum]